MKTNAILLAAALCAAAPAFAEPVPAEGAEVGAFTQDVDAAKALVAKLVDLGVRVGLDEKADKLGAKIRRAQAEKVPFMLVLGRKEAESGQVAVRTRDEGDKGAMSFEDFLATFRAAAAKRG